jgi:hypothetical protein
MKQLFTALVLLISLIAKAQQAPIMRCNLAGTVCVPYYNIDSAIISAATDDYLYLPGGVYLVKTVINKKLNIIGAGFDLDSSAVTGPTIITGNLKFGTGCNGSKVQGIRVIDTLLFVNATDNLLFSKCRFKIIDGYNDGDGAITNSTFLHVVVDEGVLFNSFPANTTFNNCILQSNIGILGGTLGGMNGCTFNNCILWGSSILNGLTIQNGSILGINFCTFQNCILLNSLYSSTSFSDNNISINNVSDNANGLDGAVSESGLVINKPRSTIFVNVPATGDFFQYGRNYRTKVGIPVTAGIYAGAYPWTDGSIPSNPHIYFKSISSSTDVNGNLPVNIKVRNGN